MKTNSVQRLVYKMVTENTGVHFLDSGFSNGRMWQRNANKKIQDFIREDEEKYTFDNKYGQLTRTVSVFHYLCGLELDDVCEKFNRRQGKDWDGNTGLLEDTYGVSERAGDWLQNNYEVEVEYTFNTYNGDSDLSQIIQGSRLRLFGDDVYYLIQVHGGADARGGYTDAKLFKANTWGDGIHEYLQEYKWIDEIRDDLEERYIDNIEDENDPSIKYKAYYVLARLNTDNTEEALNLMIKEADCIDDVEDIKITLNTLAKEYDIDELVKFERKLDELNFNPNQTSLTL